MEMDKWELDGIMDQIRAKFTVEVVPLKIGNHVLQILQLCNFEDFVAELIECQGKSSKELPYWAKVWEASFVLARFLGMQPVAPGRKILEIGAGLGIVGLYAGLCGHQVVMSDVDEDALLFARAHVLMNQVPNVNIRKLDWNHPDPGESYDMIVGSEVVYDRGTYPALVAFLRQMLAPRGMIYLSRNLDLPANQFFVELTRFFEFKQTICKVRNEGEVQEIALYAVRPKQRVPIGTTQP